MLHGEMISFRKLAYHTPILSSALIRSLGTGTLREKLKVPSGAERSCRPCVLFRGFTSNLIEKSSYMDFQQGFALSSLPFCTVAGTILVQARDPGKLCQELEVAIEELRLSDAWKLYKQYMHMEGFPRKSIVNALVTKLVETLDIQWLEKAYALFEQASEEYKQNLFEKETMIYLSLGLARCGLPVPSSTLLRKLIEMEQFPPVNAWATILAYMSQISSGAYVAAELVLEIGYLFQDGRVDPRKKINAPLLAMKPNTTAFSIALAGCLLFNTTRKAELLLDMVPRIGLKVDATLLIIMAHVYENNGRTEELKKLQRQIDECYGVSDLQFLQFHNCLLSSLLKVGDLDSASRMVLEMLHRAKKAQSSFGVTTSGFKTLANGDRSSPGLVLGDDIDHREPVGVECPTVHPLLSYEHFYRDRKFLKLEAEAKELLDDLVSKLQRPVKLVTTVHGILQPTERLYVILVKAFLEAERTKDLAEFLIKVEKEGSPVSADNSTLIYVINSCISLGLLDQAHDLLDEMRLAGIRTGSSVYTSLLKAYCKENRAGEVKSLLRDARKAGIQLDASSYEALIESRVLEKDNQGALSLFKEMKEAKIRRGGHQDFEMIVKGCSESGETDLLSKLLQEIKEDHKVDCGVHDWNNVIHFFCKKRLMQDAENAFKKMKSLGHFPNAQTFHSLVMGYAAIGSKYNEVTDLWGQMKSLASSSRIKFDQELLDAVLYTFVRGGFFVRANEVVDMMEKGNLFVDKYKYRTLFLKYHKTLYKGKAPKFQTESQVKRRDAALNFKKWVGLN